METTWAIKSSKSYYAIESDTSCDVVIVGGGLAGILTAYFLAKAGKKVIVLEKDAIGQGVTYLTTAFITQCIDASLSDLVEMFGEKVASLVWLSGAQAIKEFESIIKDENISCDFKLIHAYIYAQNVNEFTKLCKEHEVATRLGFETELNQDGRLPFQNCSYLKIKAQAKFHPLKFIQVVTEAAIEAGVTVHEHTEVVDIHSVNPVEVLTKSGVKVKTHDVVVTTHSPFNNPEILKFKKGKYKSYVIEAELEECVVEEAIYWDMKNPYNYFRVDETPKGKRIIIGGADHRAEIPMNPERNFRALEKRLQGVLGGAQYSITKKWYGPILESSDGLPFIGEYKPHFYLATAFSGNGMTYSMISAILFKDLILGHSSPFTQVYDPKRKITFQRFFKMGLYYSQTFLGGVIRNVFS